MKPRDLSETSVGAAISDAASRRCYEALFRSEVDAERMESRARKAAVADERNRIAREIYDTLAQGLAAIRLQLELARANDELPPNASQAIELAHQIANETFIDARRLISLLRCPPECLETALSAAVERARRLGPARVTAMLEPIPAPPSKVAHELLRIAQEAMQNAERHAKARTITVTLRPRPGDGLEITISDDGDGFDPASRTGGFGIAGMRERARTIHADLAIAATPGAGARVTVAWMPERDQRSAQSSPKADALRRRAHPCLEPGNGGPGPSLCDLSAANSAECVHDGGPRGICGGESVKAVEARSRHGRVRYGPDDR